MPATLEELGAQRDGLLRAKRSGVLTIRHGEKTVTYRSVAEIDKALADLNDEIAEVGGTPRRRRRVLAFQVSKGL
jgi:hypothetical protein